MFFRGISFLACVSTLWWKNQRLPASKVNPVAGYESARMWGSRSACVRSGTGIGLTLRPALVAVFVLRDAGITLALPVAKFVGVDLSHLPGMKYQFKGCF